MLLLLPAVPVLAEPAAANALRIGDASGGSTLPPLRQALIKVASMDKSSASECSIVRFTPEQAVKKLASGELEMLILERRDVPENLKNVSRIPFAAEALICYTGRGNPLVSLSVRQLKEIWESDRPVWRKYNGEFNDIHRLGMDFHHGGFAEARFLGGKLRSSGVFRSRNIRQAWLFCTPSALLCGPWMENIPADIVKIAINGVKPTPETIISGKYPLNLCYEFIVPESNISRVRQFIHLVATPEYSNDFRGSGLLPIPYKGGVL